MCCHAVIARYINIYGCGHFGYGGYVLPAEQTPDNRAYWCDPRAHGATMAAISPVYWLTFVMICALVMLSLFVGAVTMSMSESMAEMKTEMAEAERKAQLLRGMKKLAAMGDAVNLAARIESANKELGTNFLIAESTCALLGGDVEIGATHRIRVKGKVGLHDVHEVVSPASPRAD